ncbi:type II RES/Xre toxin-antitoxin system antitoxin [Motilimonas pumila]|uniref:DUF2384 domain-containing protein n=1 Tax=Motilimonas pumila TaxID=2303987 RepID=A0A418YD62_9GAMM|nr:antitoxin Xre/MbcA/ParS toxin-binding domain-containing protein [Motilimonas pumila]RJG42454.1 DUF2384 domain-containing protein [Motilimonas pumila]
MLASIEQYQPTSSHKENFWREIGVPARGEKLYQALHQGLPFSVYNQLSALSGLDKKELAKVTVIAPATLQRRAKSGHFNQVESDRLYRFAELLKAAIDLFEGNSEQAKLWLTQPVRGLGQRRPIDMLATSAETEAVMSLIGRLEHGVFA